MQKFVDSFLGKFTPEELEEIFEALMDRVDDRIEEYREIRNNRDSIGNFVSRYICELECKSTLFTERQYEFISLFKAYSKGYPHRRETVTPHLLLSRFFDLMRPVAAMAIADERVKDKLEEIPQKDQNDKS
jgi:hypothetical protein